MKRDSINDYGEYVEQQISRSTHKWGEETFKRNLPDFQIISIEVHKITGGVGNILCLGIRNGNEYWGFKNLPEFKKADIWGVDINPMVNEIIAPHIYCFDFNHLPVEWESKFDMVYSNSLDHSFKVEETIEEWRRVVKNGGYLYLSLSMAKKTTKVDVYSFSDEDVDCLFSANKFELLKSWQNQLPYLKTRDRKSVV